MLLAGALLRWRKGPPEEEGEDGDREKAAKSLEEE